MKNGFGPYGAALLLVQLAGCGPAPDQPAPVAGNVAAPASAASESAASQNADGRLVVVFGDSLFAGYNLGPDEGFAPTLQRALAARGIAARVFNAGVSGDTSAAGLARLGYVLDGLDRTPELVVVGLGANDMLRGLSPAATRANLDAILAELKRRGIPVLLTGMLAAPNLGPDYARTFDAIYPGLAKQYSVPLYPFFLDGVITNRALLLGDGVHPNRAGVAAITARVAPLVAAALPPRDGSVR